MWSGLWFVNGYFLFYLFSLFSVQGCVKPKKQFVSEPAWWCEWCLQSLPSTAGRALFRKKLPWCLRNILYRGCHLKSVHVYVWNSESVPGFTIASSLTMPACLLSCCACTIYYFDMRSLFCYQTRAMRIVLEIKSFLASSPQYLFFSLRRWLRFFTSIG